MRLFPRAQKRFQFLLSIERFEFVILLYLIGANQVALYSSKLHNLTNYLIWCNHWIASKRLSDVTKLNKNKLTDTACFLAWATKKHNFTILLFCRELNENFNAISIGKVRMKIFPNTVKCEQTTPGVYCDISFWGILPEACGTSTGRSLSLLFDSCLINSPPNREYVIRSEAVPWHLSQCTGSSHRETKDMNSTYFAQRHSESHRVHMYAWNVRAKWLRSLFLTCNTFIRHNTLLSVFSLIETHGTSRHLL